MSKKLTSSCNDTLQTNPKKLESIVENKVTTYDYSLNETYSVASEPFIGYNTKNPIEEFERIQQLAEQNKGIVTANLKDMYVDILIVKTHDFTGNDPLGMAKKWADENLVKSYISHIGTQCEFKYTISRKAIKKYLHPSATSKSESILVHLSVLKVLPNIIDASVEVEIHADYMKINEERSIYNPINKDVLIHRFYGAISFQDNLYRIKTTILENKDYSIPNKPHSFEVIKIELLDVSNSSISDSQCTNFTSKGFSIGIAKLLQNVEKSYDKGKFLLEESENH